MSFAWPWALTLLALPGAWLVVHRRRAVAPAARARPHLLRAEAGTDSVELTGGPAGRRPGHALLWSAIALAIFALARPQWGSIEEPVVTQSREILLALDLSKSMLTPDVRPSRLERSKLLIRSLLDHLGGERVGLEVFAGTAFLQVPLSSDYEIIREFLPQLRPAYLPVGGTNYAALIDTAADSFGTGDADRYLILLSDGGATDEGWQDHLSELTSRGVRVIALGVGTEAGGFIPDGAGGFLKDPQGAVVLSRLESDSLRELAEKTGGVYRDAGEWVDLPELLRSTIEAGRKGVTVERRSVRRVERFQWFLAPALALLLLSLWREFPVRPRARDIRLRSAAAPAALAALALIVLASGLGSVRAQSADAGGAAPPPGQLLGRIADRLANGGAAPDALDWADFAEETKTWGDALLDAKQAVPKGPVEDGLEAVDRGRALDAHAADWDRLAAGLRALLVPRPPPPPPPKSQHQQSQSEEQQSSQSQSRQQTVGGDARDRQPDPARADPALSNAMQKLDEVRNEDSPAELYRLIAKKNPHPPAYPQSGKDW